MVNKSPDLTPREAAVKLGVSLNQVYQLIWSEKLPAERSKEGWRIPLTAVEERQNSAKRR
jgi:excisionase family DNA binding protein